VDGAGSAAGTSTVAVSDAADGRFDPQHRQRRGGLAALREDRLRQHSPRWHAGKFLVRRAQQCSRAQPEDQDRHRQHDRGEQKTEAGEHELEFRLGGGLQRAVGAEGNAVTTELAAFAAANQAESRIQQTGPICFVQSCGCECPSCEPKSAWDPFKKGCAGAQGVITKCPNWAEFRGFVLNAPRSSAISR
jgi:hypothetical protein